MTRNSNTHHGALKQRHSRPMICQQVICWQIFYTLNRHRPLRSNQTHSRISAVPVIIAPNPYRSKDLVFAPQNPSVGLAETLVVTRTEVDIRMKCTGRFVVMVTAVTWFMSLAELSRRQLHR